MLRCHVEKLLRPCILRFWTENRNLKLGKLPVSICISYETLWFWWYDVYKWSSRTAVVFVMLLNATLYEQNFTFRCCFFFVVVEIFFFSCYIWTDLSFQKYLHLSYLTLWHLAPARPVCKGFWNGQIWSCKGRKLLPYRRNRKISFPWINTTQL